jgi:hypothetical protein
MCKVHPLCFRVLILAALAAALSPASRPGVKEDRQAVAQRIATEINSRQFKTIYVADFLDPVSGRIDKGCFFSSVFSTELTELKQGFKVINRIDAQRRLMELSSASAGQKVYSAKNLGLVMKADVLLTGKFEQQGASISLELSLVDLS